MGDTQWDADRIESSASCQYKSKATVGRGRAQSPPEAYRVETKGPDSSSDSATLCPRASVCGVTQCASF